MKFLATRACDYAPIVMKIAPRFALLLMLCTAPACELQKLGSQATSRTVAVSTVLNTPSFELPAAALAGNGFDAGTTFGGDGGVRVPAQNAAWVFFGQRQGESLDVAPVGVSGALAVLKQVGGASVPLKDQGGGQYVLQGDAGFSYQDNASYQIEVVSSGETYVAEVERVPPAEAIAEFRPAAGYVQLNAGQAFSFRRPEPPQGQERTLGFITVFSISASGSPGASTYTNIPSTPLQFLKLVVAPTEWKEANVTVPGSAFPNQDANYMVVLQSAKLGGPKSDNLFSGSVILAGNAQVAVIKTSK
jgi:hypothetical protein